MAPSNLSRDKILVETEQGFLVFLKFFPELIIQRKYGIQVEINSPFKNCSGKLSIFFNEGKGKWFYGMGKHSKIFGDIFGFIARLYKLDYKRDFAKIIKIIQQEMRGFDPTVVDGTERIQVCDGEWLEVEAITNTASIYEKYFSKTVNISFSLKEVARFKSSSCKQIKESDEELQYFAIEVIPNEFYYVFDTAEFNSIALGKKATNYFFGLEQALRLNFILNPTCKPNLLLCNNVLEVLIFNYSGVPAIQVEYNSLVNDTYFTQIIAKTFPNLIATSALLPKELKKKFKIKVFDVPEFLSGHGLDLRNYILVEHESDDFLEPLWSLYDYINDDRLTI